jgi:hypothetical protein
MSDLPLLTLLLRTARVRSRRFFIIHLHQRLRDLL